MNENAEVVEGTAITTECPAIRPHHVLTAEDRRKGGEATKRKYAERRTGVQQAVVHPVAERPTFLHARVADVEAEIIRTHRAFNHADSPKDRRELATSLDKLYQTWSLLTGHERPGIRKAKARREQSSSSIVILPKEIESSP